MIPGRREELIDSGLNKIYNKYNIAELQSSFRYVNWKLLMRKLFGDKVNNSQLFLVHFPSYLRQLDRMVSLFGLRFPSNNFVMYVKIFSILQSCETQSNCFVCPRSTRRGGQF